MLWDRISKADTNGDGKISKEELEAQYKASQFRHPETGKDSTKPAESPKDAKPEEKKPEEKPKDNLPQTGSRLSDDGFRIG